MSQPHPHLGRAVRASLFACAVLAIAACTAKDDGAAADSSDTTTGAKSGFMGAPASGTPALPGALTKDVAQYTGAEFRTFVQGLAWGDSVNRARPCTGDPACDGPAPSRSTTASIAAVQGQDSLTLTGLPQYGVVAARLDNTGNLRERMYGLQPGNRYQYYVIVYRNTDSVATWKLEELSRTGTTYSHRTVREGPFRGCGHPWTPGARADFKTCAQAAALHAPALMQRGDSSGTPGWMSCAAGCCVVDDR